MDKEKDNGQIEDQDTLDPWAQAFAALESEDGEKAEDSEQVPGQAADDAGQDDGSASDATDGDQLGDGAVGSVSMADGSVGEDGGSSEGVVQISYEDYESDLQKLMQQQAMDDMAEYFRSKNVMHDKDGRLGAYPEHPAIMRKGDDGLPEFINPDTGEPFSGSNPRAEARTWCDEYNRTLNDLFVKAVQKKQNELMEEQAPALRTVRFAPTYESLDPVRRQMLDNIIEDYEVSDSDGNVIGYSCDLDKALAAVNRQIASIKNMNKANVPATEPALDMKSSAGKSNDVDPKNFKSVDEALGWLQDQELQKAKKGKR